MSNDWYRYLMPSDRVVSYAWNAGIVCVPCVMERLAATLRDEALPDAPITERDLEECNVEQLRALYCTLILERPESERDDLDTSEMPQAVFAGSEGSLADSCDSCHERIEDTL